MTNDILEFVAARMTAQFKKLLFTESGKLYIKTEDGNSVQLDADWGNVIVKPKFSSWQEWIGEISQLSVNNDSLKYPFVFVDSIGTGTTNDVTTYPRIMIVIPTISMLGRDTYTTDRDALSFKPILNILHRLFYEALYVNKDCSVSDRGTRKDHYFHGKYNLVGADGNEFTDKVDAIELNQLKLRIYKKV